MAAVIAVSHQRRERLPIGNAIELLLDHDMVNVRIRVRA
jgi:hypothetical protein